MDCHLNLAVVSGYLERAPHLATDDQGRQKASFTLRLDELRDDIVYKLFIPCEAYSQAAQDAALCQPGMLVGVEGKLCWRAYVTRTGEKKSGLAVFVRAVKLLRAVLPPGHGGGG